MARSARILATGALFAACFATGLLLPRPAIPQDGLADTAGHGLGMSATTGQVRRDVSALYLVDHDTRRVAVYHAFGGKDLVLAAVRNIDYDLQLRAFRDGSPRMVDVRVLRELFRRHVGEGDPELPDGRRRPR
jgi:hypothetical protein